MIECREQSTENRKEKGVVLILTFIIMTTLTAIVVAFLSMTSIQTKGAGYDIVSHKALWLAEGGIQQVIYQLKNDANYRNNPTTVTGNLGNGSYSVTVSKDGSTYTLTSTGRVDVLNRKIQQSMVVSEGAPQAFNYVHHSGNNISFNNSEGTITGNISAVGTVNQGSMTINGTVTQNSSVTTPTVNFSSYQSIANNIVNGNKTFQEDQTHTGIWYVNGNVTIEEGVTINGSIIATGNINMNNAENVTINPTSPYPALVSGGNLTGNNMEDSNISGLIYATNNITLNNNEDNTFNGTIIAGGKIDMKNGEDFTITYNSNILSNPPPYFSGGGSIAVTPQKDWNEIVPAT